MGQAVTGTDLDATPVSPTEMNEKRGESLTCE